MILSLELLHFYYSTGIVSPDPYTNPAFFRCQIRISFSDFLATIRTARILDL